MHYNDQGADFKYLIVNERDKRFGLSVTTVGFQAIRAGSVYPPRNHPDAYYFTAQKGRVLHEYQLVPHRLYPLPAGAGGPADRGVRQPGGKGEGHLRLRHRTGGLPLSARLPPAGLHRRPVRQDPPGGLRGVRPALHHPVPYRGHPRPVAERAGRPARPGGPPRLGHVLPGPPRLAVGGLLLRLLRPPQRGGRPPGPLLRQPGPLADGSQFRLPGPPDAPHARLAARPLRQPVRRADGGFKLFAYSFACTRISNSIRTNSNINKFSVCRG